MKSPAVVRGVLRLLCSRRRGTRFP